LSAVERGIAHHTFLEHLALERTDGVAALREEAGRLVGKGVLTPAEVGVLDFEALAEFWRSELGRRIRQETARVQRELEFTAGFSAAELAGLGLSLQHPLPAEETLVVQGVVDLAVIRPEAIWLVDFKTDDVTPTTLEEKVTKYAPQLRLYGLALERIWRRPVTECWLHFLKIGRSVAVSIGPPQSMSGCGREENVDGKP
jgi:ATP-dependent helicase/nuclease subunit A